jgi:hypothetical protein
MPRGIKGSSVKGATGGLPTTGSFGQPQPSANLAKSFAGTKIQRIERKASKTQDPSLGLGLPGGSRIGRLAGQYGKSTIDQPGPDPMKAGITGSDT